MKKFFCSGSRILRFMALTVCTVLLIASAGCGKPESGKTETDPNVTIDLPGNPTTGYVWTYTVSQEGILTEVLNQYIPTETDGQTVGSGGVFRFIFGGAGRGEVSVAFSYARPWDEQSEIMTAEYVLSVDERNIVTVISEPENVDPSGHQVDKIVAGEEFTDTIYIEGMEESTTYTWTLCNAGFYIGVDSDYIQWYYADGADHLVPKYGNPEGVRFGTLMTAKRHFDSSSNAEGMAEILIENDHVFSEHDTLNTEIGGLPAVAVSCMAEGLGASMNYYFIDAGSDVIEICLSFEGENAEGMGTRLYAMLDTIVFTDEVGFIQ